MNFDSQNILVINFGQIGDVILSLPAMNAIREKFPQSKLTILVGKSARDIVEMSDLFDEVIIVDRNELKKGKNVWAIRQIIKLIADVRRRKFDFVIDLHSLYETNLLGYISGAKKRLFADRANRSLDFLSNFDPKPPPLDRSLHLTDYYLQNLLPLGIENAPRSFQIHPSQINLETVKEVLNLDKIEGKKLVGLNLGAGNPSRYWGLENFAELAQRLSQEDNDLQVLVFYGPEEKHLEKEIRETFPNETIINSVFNLQELGAAFSYLKVLIGNDTGPMHLGAVVGTPVVLVMEDSAPVTYLPLGENVHVVQTGKLDEISVEEVFQATQKLL